MNTVAIHTGDNLACKKSILNVQDSSRSGQKSNLVLFPEVERFDLASPPRPRRQRNTSKTSKNDQMQ
jgi:hypothetical protein